MNKIILNLFRIILCITLLVLTLLGCAQPSNKSQQSGAGYQRIVSLVPSITETLFALGAGDRVVGVSRFSTFPSEVAALPKVGGFTDPNYELILRLKPDLVIGMVEQREMARFCKKMRIAYCAIDNHNLAAILESFAVIGKVCNKSAQADSLTNFILAQIRPLGPDSLKAPRMLVCAGRNNVGSKNIASVYAAGPRTFYEDLIRGVGAVNVISDSTIDYPNVSTEAMVRLQPDIIVDIMDPTSALSDSVLALDWRFVQKLSGNQELLVFVLKRDYASIPGPRVSLILKDLKGFVAAFHKAAL